MCVDMIETEYFMKDSDFNVKFLLFIVVTMSVLYSSVSVSQ